MTHRPETGIKLSPPLKLSSPGRLSGGSVPTAGDLAVVTAEKKFYITCPSPRKPGAFFEAPSPTRTIVERFPRLEKGGWAAEVSVFGSSAVSGIPRRLGAPSQGSGSMEAGIRV